MMNLKGTKTEANLMAAFAGESQARNKYTYYASKAKKEGYEQIAALFLETANKQLCSWKQPTTKKNTQKSGSNCSMTALCLPQLKTCWTLHRAKTTNGQTCTLHSQKKQEKKASTALLTCLKQSVRSKNITKNVTANCWKTLKAVWYSPEMAT